MRSFVIMPLIIGLILAMQSATAQDFESDPEVKDIRTRVFEVSYQIETHQYSFDGESPNDTEIRFTILMELWNPYDSELVSYGSSSCRWLSHLDPHFSSPIEMENYGEACTADWGPREHPSGLSNETSHPSILILNQTLDNVPEVTIFINGIGGFYNNKTDLFYGANMTITQNSSFIEYESIPSNWGEILYDKETESKLKLDVSYLPVIAGIGMVGLLHRRIELQ
ncbi:MAG: hypothetical protein ACXAB7_09620 [Candidatus Kariarchaeaceae archaeon]